MGGMSGRAYRLRRPMVRRLPTLAFGFQLCLCLCLFSVNLACAKSGFRRAGKALDPASGVSLDGVYKRVDGGMGAAFTESQNWDSAAGAEPELPKFNTPGLPSVPSSTDSFEKKMQQQSSDASPEIPGELRKEYHDTDQGFLNAEKKWEAKERLQVRSHDKPPVPDRALGKQKANSSAKKTIKATANTKRGEWGVTTASKPKWFGSRWLRNRRLQ